MQLKWVIYSHLLREQTGKKFFGCLSGQAVVEYALFVGAVCAALILVLYSASDKFSKVVNVITQAAEVNEVFDN